jgi:hypothetical protein
MLLKFERALFRSAIEQIRQKILQSEVIFFGHAADLCLVSYKINYYRN